MNIRHNKTINFETWISPIIFLGICVAAFGLQIYWLGYTVDDWIILYSYYSEGLYGLMEYSFMGSRPLIFWAWYVGFELLGTSPLNWQIWTIFWRFLTIIFFWMILRKIWPNKSLRNFLIALLFSIYPVFFQQPSAITFSFHWICFSLYMISILTMIKAISNEGNFFLFSLVSIFLGAISLFSQEFFIGLELLRVMIIWHLLKKNKLSRRRLLNKTLINWLPYLLMFSGYLIWRFFSMPIPGVDRNSPKLFALFVESPISALGQFLEYVIRDLVNIVFGVWYHTLKPEIISFQPISLLFSWVLVGIVFTILVVIFFKLKIFIDEKELASKDEWTLIISGAVASFLGMLPGWIIGRSISDPSGLYNDRFGLAAMPGVSLLLVGIIIMIIKSKRTQLLILSLLVALASGQHFRSTSEYRWSWEEQLRLYWQLKWRIPDLQPPVAVYGNGALIKFMGSWATVSALNLMYPTNVVSDLEPFWYFDLTKTKISSSVENNTPVFDRKNNLFFYANAKDSIVIQSNVFPSQCVWVLDINDKDNPFLTSEVRYALPLSNFDKIISFTETTLDPNIFGAEINHDWCYYFQKADLASQHHDWNTILELWKEAEINGFTPYNGPELINFIRAAAFVGNWDLGLELTKKATFLTDDMNDYLCTTWENIHQEIGEQSALKETIAEINDQYYCRIGQN
jgi:hypothetical protein